MAGQEGLGRVLNVIMAASGVDVPLTRAEAVTFVTYEDDGSTILTLTQTDSTGTNSEINLATITRVHKGPGVGGTWTKVTQAAANTYDLNDDTTKDAVVLTVRAEELADGYDQVQLTTDGGICVAILHDLKTKRTPENLTSSIVA